MIERAMSLSMFSRNNSETILQYNRLATSLPDSPEHVAFLGMKLQVWKGITAEWGRVHRREERGSSDSSDSSDSDA